MLQRWSRWKMQIQQVECRRRQETAGVHQIRALMAADLAPGGLLLKVEAASPVQAEVMVTTASEALEAAAARRRGQRM